jgi:hypothetical protein
VAGRRPTGGGEMGRSKWGKIAPLADRAGPQRWLARSPPMLGFHWVRQTKLCIAPVEIQVWGRNGARFAAPAHPNGDWASGNALIPLTPHAAYPFTIAGIEMRHAS